MKLKIEAEEEERGQIKAITSQGSFGLALGSDQSPSKVAALLKLVGPPDLRTSLRGSIDQHNQHGAYKEDIEVWKCKWPVS